MKITPMVSIITPAYNCAHTIIETIESVLTQTMTNWEMIIVDDCSMDQTLELITQYSKMDDRIKVISLKKNSGSAAARNIAIDNAEGRYIALLDSDDLWKPDKLKKQIKFMQDNNFAFTFTAYDIFKNTSDENRKVFNAPKSINYKQYLRNSIIGCLTVMIDKQQIPNFHMENGYLEDVLTWMLFLKKGIVAYGLNENLASYRVCNNSKSANKFKNAKRYYQCLKAQKELGVISRLYCQIGYMYNATKKRIFSKRSCI